jgi:cellulose synthase/poly-beta-1,6-N-acetylglucosamine synthase-like glycosyltransferase
MTGLTEIYIVLFGIVLLNALACLTLTGLQVFCAMGPSTDEKTKDQTGSLTIESKPQNPYFSVHVPTHNEPPDIVIAVL